MKLSLDNYTFILVWSSSPLQLDMNDATIRIRFHGA